MAYDEMELDLLGDRRTALFVIISDTDDTFNFVVSIMYDYQGLHCSDQFSVQERQGLPDGRYYRRSILSEHPCPGTDG